MLAYIPSGVVMLMINNAVYMATMLPFDHCDSQ